MAWETNTSILGKLETFSAQTAWSLLSQQFRLPLERFARRVGLSGVVAEDVVQESLMAFATRYRAGDYDRTKGRLSSWLFGIARNQAQLALRRVQRADDSKGVGRAVELAAPSALEALWEEEWRSHVLSQCMERVRREVEPNTLEAFRLTVLEELPAGEVAERLGIPRTRVYNARHRVAMRLQKLAQELDDL